MSTDSARLSPSSPAPRTSAPVALSWWQRVLRAPDPALIDAGAASELAIARLRLVLTAALLLIPLQTFAGGAPRASLVGLLSALLALVAATSMFVLARRGRYMPWMGATSSLLDVSLVSLGLVVVLLAGYPGDAVNSRVQFEVYFLAIAATGLRYDTRICLLAGIAAAAQYLAVAGWAAWRFGLGAPGGASVVDEAFSWTTPLSRVVLLAVATALAAEAVRRAQRLRLTATRDRLTGLFNRGYVEGRAAEELARGTRYGRSFSVAMLDVDHFKDFNDRHGHAAGDQVLRTVALRLQATMRGTDIVGRWGGEEFVILLPETSVDAAASRLEAFRARLAEERAVHEGHTLDRITVSAGVAAWPADGADVEELIARADERLYEAKESGRNRVVAESDG